ncbi:MAG TPA: acyltransferase, partial [Rhodanobacteraceae bacterium]|nr:acyltransferase [Rhodanobacteraceae bacterium]
MLLNLNTLRAFAALLVVYYHITSDAGLNLAVNIGTRGVDVFFVISGFIITYVGSRNPEQFFARRLIRIVPFYWAATIFVFLIALVFPHLFHNTRADVPQLLASLFFIPRETDYAGLYPTLILGWSLNYEMYFYALFAISLLIARSYAAILCSVLIALVLIAIDLSGATHPSITFYARPIVFEFVLGVVSYYLVTWVSRRKAAIAGGKSALWLLALVMLGSIAVLGVGEYRHGWGLSREVSAGIPAFFLVTSAILIERLYRIVIDNRAVFLLGESSYILYLVHPYVIYGILRTLLRHPENLGSFATAALVVALLAIASAVAVAIHLVFERPVMELLRRKLLRPRVKRREDELVDTAPALGGAY